MPVWRDMLVSACPYPTEGFQGLACRGIHALKKTSDHRTTERLLPEDYEQRDFILSGIKDGFHIIDPDCISHSVEMDNYASAAAENMRAQIEAQILTEI